MSVEYVGPFETHVVVVDGWRVPHLEADMLNGGRIHLCLDNRYGLDVEVADADRVVRFIADCIAVAAGYACHPREDMDAPIPLPPFVRMHGITLEQPDG